MVIELALRQTSGLTSILIPGPEVICGWDHNKSDEGREEIKKRVAAVIVLELLPGHFVAALGSPFFSTAAILPLLAKCVRVDRPLASQLAFSRDSSDHRCTWCTPAQCGLPSSSWVSSAAPDRY